MTKILTTAGVVFCLLSLATFSLAAETIKIGAYLPMTGAVAAYGQDAWNGIQIAREMQPAALGRNHSW